jgi:hypothetical protein
MKAISIRQSACDQVGKNYGSVFFFSLNSTQFANYNKQILDKIKAFTSILWGVHGVRKRKTMVWSRRKYHNSPISEAVNWDTGVQTISVSDDAFAFMLLENYLDKWKNNFVAKANGVVLDKKLDGKYPVSCQVKETMPLVDGQRLGRKDLITI